jgi:hypothetical protein
MSSSESGTHSTRSAHSSIPWKLWATLVAVCFAVYKLFTAPPFGDAVFGLVIAVLLYASETRFVPSDIVTNLRQLFKYGDRYARLCIFIIAIGGTALSIKEAFGLSILPDQVDFWVKRSGPPLVVIATATYFASILAKITFVMSDVHEDAAIRRFEFLFYVSSVSFYMFVLALFMGLGFMDTFVTSQHDRQSGLYVWSDPARESLVCGTLVTLIWAIAYGLCVFSRYCEWSLRERYVPTSSVRSSKLGPGAGSVDTDDVAAVVEIISGGKPLN